jgi:2-amino-4-hydroxy-6-hydroxymethyldihydropteridine diphosphokinase
MHHTPEILMDKLLYIESLMGRVRQQKWEPRIIDLDILFFDHVVLQGALNIPHPLLHERRFTLEPLNELAPELVHPVLGKTVAQLLASCTDNSDVEKL